jgi:tetratricopeptide (TPR) repeat protein
MEARLTMVEKFPEGKYYLEHMAKVGFNYESIADFGQAAEWYERLFKEAPEYKDTKNALYRAAFFRKRMGLWEQAIVNKRDYMKAYPDEALTVTLPIDIANVYKEHGKLAKSAKEFEAYYQKPHKDATDENIFYARLQHSKILGMQRKTTYQKKVWKYTVEAFDKYKEKMAKEEKPPSAVVRTYVAEIMYYMAQKQNNSYLSLKIDGPKGSSSPAYVQRVLNKQIKTKIEKLKEVRETYQKIVLVQGGKWSLEALVEIGKAYDNYAETIISSYVPKFLDEEIYKMKLEDQAFNYRQKGIAFYEKAIEVAFQNSLYTKATEYAMKRLGEFDPERYSKREEDILQPSYLSKSTRNRAFIQTIE